MCGCGLQPKVRVLWLQQGWVGCLDGAWGRHARVEREGGGRGGSCQVRGTELRTG